MSVAAPSLRSSGSVSSSPRAYLIAPRIPPGRVIDKNLAARGVCVGGSWDGLGPRVAFRGCSWVPEGVPNGIRRRVFPRGSLEAIHFLSQLFI